MAPHPLTYLRSFFGLLDVVTIIPTIVVFILIQADAPVEESNTFAFLRLARALRVFRLQALFPLIENDVYREGAKMVMHVLSSVFVWAGIAQVCGAMIAASTGVWCGFVRGACLCRPLRVLEWVLAPQSCVRRAPDVAAPMVLCWCMCDSPSSH